MSNASWKKSERWTRRATAFCVEVVHSVSSIDAAEHIWNVYAYIYPSHPHFKNFERTDRMWQDAATVLPLHGGPSFLKWHFDINLNPTSVQVGCDYNHLYDDNYLEMDSEDEAGLIFTDAESLFQWLENYMTGTNDCIAGVQQQNSSPGYVEGYGRQYEIEQREDHNAKPF